MRQMETKTWCVEWFGSEGDFLAGGKRQPIPLAHLSGLENLVICGKGLTRLPSRYHGHSPNNYETTRINQDVAVKVG